MDGRKARLRDSLQFQLSAWLSGAVILLALGAGAYSFSSSFEEANELQDDQLRQVAALLAQHAVRLDNPQDELEDKSIDPDLRVIAQLVGPVNGSTGVAPGLLVLPSNLPDGLQTVRAGREDWRLLIRSLRGGQRLAVGQQTAARDEIARHGALRTVLPLLTLMPLLVILVSLVVRYQLKPLAKLASEVDRRSENDLTPLPQTPLSTEIRPFARSISLLLERLRQSIEMQRRFVADAAHELRSPLTAVSLQAEALGSTGLSLQAEEQVTRLRLGVQRARGLVDQLLAFARSQARPVQPAKPLSALSVLHTAIEDLMPLAEARGIDLGVSRQEPVRLHGLEADFYAIVRNLVDNAIRYGPPGGRVDVSLNADSEGVLLEVINGGVGIPPTERERVFDPFYRVLGTDADGSGLGLPIVKTLAERMGGSITLHDASLEPGAPGLRVQVRFAPS